MTLSDIVVLNGFSVSILFLIIIYYERNGDKASRHTRLFLGMLKLAVLMMVVDSMGRFDGNPDTIYPVINWIGNFLIFMLAPALPSLWLLYVNYYISPDGKVSNVIKALIITVNVVVWVLVISSQFTGWLYSIDDMNIYQRGPLYIISPILTFILLLTSMAYVVLYKHKIQHTHFIPFMAFPAMPFIGTLMQAFIYGYPFALMGLLFSVLTIAFFAQSIETNMDYLSGVYNRKRLEGYLHRKIATSTPNSTFSAIMADVNDLKSINDTFGHTVGDEALVTISSLLRSILRSNDFVARYGGDEFCIILDTSNEETLARVVNKIKRQLTAYNEMSLKPYQLSLSMGYAVYDPKSGQNEKEFYNLIDTLMYEDKKKYHIEKMTQGLIGKTEQGMDR
jgi:diguanylate cyclase (GGDEF)-like protein